jgi:hypothetical protein
MSRKKPEPKRLKHPVTTWLTDGDYDALKHVAQCHGVAASSYMRAVIIDALADEKPMRDQRVLMATA